MLVGNPKSGKTSIVEALSLCFLQDGQFRPFFIRNTDEFFTITSYLPASEGALFICDDIFGKHELDQSKLQDWTDYFQSIMGTIAANRKFIFTTRQYIYEEFANKSDLRVFFPNENDPARYVLELSELSRDERQQILEKHLLTSNLSSHVIELVRASEDEILDCKDFSPEVVRSLIALIEKAKVGEVSELITRHIKHPNQYLYDFFNNLNMQKRLLLLALILSITPDAPDVEALFLSLLKDVGELPQVVFQTFINELEGSIVKRREYLESSELEYYHPSMYDAIVDICKRDAFYRNLMLKNVNLELLYLFTFRKAEKDSIKIQILTDQVNLLTEGIDRLVCRERTLRDVSRVLQWIILIKTEIPYIPLLLKPFNLLSAAIGIRLASNDFFNTHHEKPLEDWINLLDKWNVIFSKERIQYAEQLEIKHRNSTTYDYWRLVFLLESNQEGFIERVLPVEEKNTFVQKLRKAVVGLRLGLNVLEGKPKTEESWYPLYREVDDLVTKMKKSGTGRQIIDSYLISDWNDVKQFSQFAKNRHSGMVQHGYWKTFKNLRNFHRL